MPSVSHLPELIEMRPLILITGFLGAGKTTLLRELLITTKAEGLKSHVILNDYGDAEIDSARIKEIAEDVEPLTAGCACCEGMDFMLELSVKANQSDSDLLFIELNGTADPVPLVEAFTLLEDKLKRHPRWHLCVINPSLFGQRGQHSDIEELQLQTASHIYLSHTENKTNLEAVVTKILKVNPSVSILTKEELTEGILTVTKKNNKRILQQRSQQLTTSKTKSAAHLKTHEFTSCKLPMPKETTREKVKEWLSNLPHEVMRAKVLVGLEGLSDRYLFERVGTEVSPYFQKVKLGKNVDNSAILIGPTLNPEALKLQVKEFFTFS